MSTTITSTNRFRRLTATMQGYIGIDIGTHCIRMAQLKKRGSQWQIAGKWALRLPVECRPTTIDGLSAAIDYFLSQWEELGRMFVGHATSVALPMCLTPLRSMEIPNGSRDEMVAMVRDELADEMGSVGNFAFEFWPTKPASGGMATLATVTVPHTTAQTVSTPLLARGLECQTLDAMPFVFSRMTRMTPGIHPGQPTAVLELGETRSHLFFCRNGEPGFCRLLPDVGMESIHHAFQSRLGLNRRESEFLLARVGVAGSQHSRTANDAMESIVGPAVEQLVYELQRTLTYVTHELSDQYPETIWVVANGARIRHLASVLADRLEIDVRVWSGSQPESDDPEFAAACSLSALSWEEPSCE